MNAKVGSRELKTRLGAYLQRVRGGSTLLVTERGRPVAELRPLEHEGGGDAGLAALEALGVVSRKAKARLGSFRPVRSAGRPVSEAVVEAREERF